MFSTDKISIVVLLLFVVFSGCRKSEAPAPQSNVVAQEFAIPGCSPGDARWFPLEQVATNRQDQHLGFFLSTNGFPFMFNHCLCEVQNFKIPVGQISQHEDDPVLIEYSGVEELEHYVQYGSANDFDTIVIVNPSEIMDPGLELMITFRGDFNASVDNAGGLCIVDNLSGIYTGKDTSVVFTTPWILEVPVAPGDSITKVYIPNAMTSPF